MRDQAGEYSFSAFKGDDDELVDGGIVTSPLDAVEPYVFFAQRMEGKQQTKQPPLSLHPDASVLVVLPVVIDISPFPSETFFSAVAARRSRVRQADGVAAGRAACVLQRHPPAGRRHCPAAGRHHLFLSPNKFSFSATIYSAETNNELKIIFKLFRIPLMIVIHAPV